MEGSFDSDGTCSFSVRSPACSVSRGPSAHSSCRKRPTLFTVALPAMMTPRLGSHVVAANRVVAVASLHAREPLPPEQVDHVAGRARQRVDSHAIELHTALHLVSAGRGERDGPVYLEAVVRAARAIPADVRRDVRETARVLVRGRHAREDSDSTCGRCTGRPGRRPGCRHPGRSTRCGR